MEEGYESEPNQGAICVCFLSYLREGIEGSLEGSVGEELKT